MIATIITYLVQNYFSSLFFTSSSDRDRDGETVVTAYRTTKLRKHWREE